MCNKHIIEILNNCKIANDTDNKLLMYISLNKLRRTDKNKVDFIYFVLSKTLTLKRMSGLNQNYNNEFNKIIDKYISELSK